MNKKTTIKTNTVAAFEQASEIVSCSEFASKLQLETASEGRGEIEFKTISVNRPGLQMTGYFEHFANERVQVIGNAEKDFFSNLPTLAKQRVSEEFFKREIPCLIFSRNLEIDDEILEAAEQYDCPVFRSKNITAVLINELTNYLSNLLSPMEIIHGVMLDISGVGVLITGDAGIGKSETALELISRGHRLVADDSVIIKNNGGKLLVASCPAQIQYYMEVRGVGIINVKAMFGPGAVRPEKTVELIAELVPWGEMDGYDRLGDEKLTESILGIEKQKLVIPVSPGRNIPIILEAAARKFRLEESGYNAATELLNNAFKK